MIGHNRFFFVIKRMVHRFFSDGIPQAAAELSYFLLFSLFPLLMFTNAILAQLDISIDSIRPMLDMLPRSLQELIEGYLLQLSNSPSFSSILIAILLTLYFLSRAVRSMMRTVNDIYHVEVGRGIFSNALISFAITAGFLASVVCSFVVVVAGRMLIRLIPDLLPIPSHALSATQDAGFWVMIAVVFLFLLLFNRFVPNLQLRFGEVWPGALFSLLAWLLVSWAFSFYVDNMANYSVLYGSLAAIIVLMLWLYIVGMILLMGPQLNHTLATVRMYHK